MYPKLITFGNVLLDFTYNIERNTDIASKYGFNLNGLGECSSEILSQVVKEANETCDFLSSQTGGSALNTSKILSLLGESDVVFCGAIGNDSNGVTVRQHLENVQLKARLQKFKNYPTGTCICLINKENRCCYANIAASIHFEKKYFETEDLILQCFDPTSKPHNQIFYIEGFFITGYRFSMCKYVVDEICKSSGGSKIFSTNLSAEYLIDNHADEIKYLAENAFILFGNRCEFTKLAHFYQLSRAEDAIEHLIRTKPMENNNKIIICTHGADWVLYSSSSEMIINERYHFDPIPKDQIIDTTGCGDAFVAGFFYAFLRNEPTVKCVAKGVEVAQKKITSVGSTFLK